MSEFYAHPRMADGHLNKCKECAKADSRNADPVKRAAYERERYKRPERKKAVRESIVRARKRDPERFARYARDARARNPEKYAARSAVGNALRDGRLKKGRCEVCGSEKVQAHHDDYSKPLEVRWLCIQHHNEHHARVGSAP